MNTVLLEQTMLAHLEQLWLVPQTQPEEPLLWTSDFTDGERPLESFEQLHDLIEGLRVDSFVTVYPSTQMWYTQCLRQPVGFHVEVAHNLPFWTENFALLAPGGRALTVSETYALMAQFCRDQQVPGGYAVEQTLYDGS